MYRSVLVYHQRVGLVYGQGTIHLHVNLQEVNVNVDQVTGYRKIALWVDTKQVKGHNTD